MLWKKAAAASSGLPLPTFVSSSVSRATSSTTTVTAPTGIQNGDLLVAVGFFDDPTKAVSTVPSGFSLSQEASTNALCFYATKVAASESGNYTFTFNASGPNCVVILVYRNATDVNTVGDKGAGSSTTGTAPSITPTYRGTLCAFFFAESNSATVSTPPSGMTERALATGSFLRSIAAYDLFPQSASATGDKSLVWSTTSTFSSFLLQITNEKTVAPEFVASANTQTSAQATSFTINKPTGTVEGDLMVAVMAADSTTTWTGDTGWTEVAEQGATSPSLRVAYKVAGASEGASYTFTSSSNRRLSGVILTYRYAAYDTIGSFVTNADPLVLTSISPSESQSVLLAAGARAAPSVTLGTPTSMTARFTDNDTTAPSFIVCSQEAPKGPVGSRSMSTGDTNSVAGILLSIKPTRSL